MAYRYTNQEYLNMILIYGEVNQNAARAAAVYRERYPGRHAPAPRTFVRVCQKLLDTGSVQSCRGQDGGPGRSLRVLNAEQQILNRLEEDPSVSTRTIAREVGVSQSIVWRTLREAQLYPYHVQHVEALASADYPVRKAFCEWFLEQNNRHPRFTADVLATDEACFTQNGIQNFHNTHQWAAENPDAASRSACPQTFSINLWAGLVNDTLIGPFELPAHLNGGIYLDFFGRNATPITGGGTSQCPSGHVVFP
ncbi:hypothetical protein NQ317_003360 [Molorchus minor]|uniref:DUF4817 domain-containing protein n=1 Tax=Molorchus minor TaxID=1323400 RepID=A0ABQ9K7R6_9CUCU|nr:hypothetical protein NQ317_003360 [Molorchus minor]